MGGTIPVKSATFLAVMVARRVSFSCLVTTTGVLAGGGGDRISSMGSGPRKARYCFMVSFGGVVTGKSNVQREKERKRKRELKFGVKLMAGKFEKGMKGNSSRSSRRSRRSRSTDY